MMADITFANKELLWLLLVIPVMIGWYVLKLRAQHAEVRLSSLQGFQGIKTGAKQMLRHSLFGFRTIAVAALIISLARPQSSTSWQDVVTEGIDIVIALDISGSMLAEDFKPNRLEAAKDLAIDFIKGRNNDRIGLVIYSAESFTLCPLTTDHAVLKNLFRDVKNGMVEDGTAIGMGLANAVSRLKNSDAKSKVVILLTDGFNTTGSIPPLTAAEIAQAFDVRVYSIGVGTNGTAPYPFQNPFGGVTYQDVEVRIDEETMQKIADMTGGKYFRATNNEKLKEIYKEIDKLEKSKIEVTEYRKKHEEFLPLAILAAILLGMEFLLRNTVFRSIT